MPPTWHDSIPGSMEISSNDMAADRASPKMCKCMVCTYQQPLKNSGDVYTRHCHHCDYSAPLWAKNLNAHVRSHYGKPGQYRCPAEDCPSTKKIFPQWAELARHTKDVHCEKSRQYLCPELHCQYHTQGFTRKYRLTNHIRVIHANKARPGRPHQRIAPATAEASGSSERGA